MEMLTVLYDASCGFCSSCRKWLEAQPAYIPLEFVPAGSPAAERLFPGLSPTAGDELVVGDDGSVYRGGAAWIVCLWALEDSRSLAERLSTPSLYPLARQAFQFVSQTRREISQALALRSDEGVAQQLSEVPSLSCGREDSSFLTTAQLERPSRPRIARRASPIFILFLIAFVLLANHSQSVLLWAADRGIVTRGATLRRLGLDLERALESAAREGDVERVRFLLELGADPNRGLGRRALVDAAIQHRQTVVQILRSAGAQADIRDADGRTPLMLQAADGDVGAVRGLLAAGADPNARDNNGDAPLFFVVESHFFFQSDSKGNVLLSSAEVFQLLLSAGADPNARGRDGRPVLMSTSHGLYFVFCDLLEAGADPNVRDEYGRTALMEAGPTRAKALLDSGANPNLADKEGQTALHRAAQERHLEGVDILLASGANAGVEAAGGFTPFLTAVQWSSSQPDDFEVVRRLFSATPLARRDRDLAHALRIARHHKDHRVQALLAELDRSGQSSASR